MCYSSPYGSFSQDLRGSGYVKSFLHVAEFSLVLLPRPRLSLDKTHIRGGYSLACCRASASKQVVTREKSVFLKIPLPAILLCGCCVFAQESNAGQPLPLSSIVTRMEASQAQKRDSGAYEVVRQYRVAGAKSSTADSDVVAAVNFDPPSNRSFTIQKATGSSRGEQVVR